MAIVKNDYGYGVKSVTVPAESGVVVTERFETVITDDIEAADILEVGILPAGAVVVDAVLVAGAMGGTTTANAGIMTGEVGSEDISRTVGDELFSAVDVAAASVTRATQADVFGGIAKANTDRSLGVQFSDDVTAADQVVALVVSYRV